MPVLGLKFDRSGIRSHMPQFVVEFLIIFLSITFSWWVEDLRQEREHRQQESVILSNLLKNLETDSLRLSNEIHSLENNLSDLDSLYSKVKLSDGRPFEILSRDALSLIVIPEFHPARSEFEAVKSTGQLAIIENDSLVRRMMDLYEVTYGELFFILEIDRMTFTENSWAEVIRDFPLHRVFGPESRSAMVSFTAEERERFLSRLAFYRLAIRASIPRFAKCLDEVDMLRKSIRARQGEME